MHHGYRIDPRSFPIKTGGVQLFAALVLVALLATGAAAAGQVGSYAALKAGIYSPSAKFDLANIGVETTFDADTKTGFDGELAFGHYFAPSFALELGIGYLKSKGSYADEVAAQHDLDFNVIPLILSAKLFAPIAPVFPYGEVGVGAYFSEFNVSGNANSFNGTTTFGVHAGAGLNVDVAESVFVGLEARYVWNDPSFGGQQIDLNGNDYSLDGFKLNGFTTTFGLGFAF